MGRERESGSGSEHDGHEDNDGDPIDLVVAPVAATLLDVVSTVAVSHNPTTNLLDDSQRFVVLVNVCICTRPSTVQLRASIAASYV